jgi:hypothetical protein
VEEAFSEVSIATILCQAAFLCTEAASGSGVHKRSIIPPQSITPPCLPGLQDWGRALFSVLLAAWKQGGERHGALFMGQLAGASELETITAQGLPADSNLWWSCRLGDRARVRSGKFHGRSSRDRWPPPVERTR